MCTCKMIKMMQAESVKGRYIVDSVGSSTAHLPSVYVYSVMDLLFRAGRVS